MSAQILRVDDLVVHFPVKVGGELEAVRAVDGVSLHVQEGETLGLVGESGAGKSTVARAVLRLVRPQGGKVVFLGKDITRLTRRQMRPLRREMQVVFQDPYASLNPRRSVHAIVAEPLRIHGVYERGRVDHLLRTVGLDPRHGRRFPHEFSGGQRQRIGIARALALEPRLLILDEPVSSLDVSIQAQILNLLRGLQERLGLSYLLIAHDLAVVRQMCDRVAVMHLGKIVEQGPRRQIYQEAGHPYTQALLSAVPVPDPSRRDSGGRVVLEGEMPSAIDPPSGCRFRTRCWKAEQICAEEEPALVPRWTGGQPCACYFAEPYRRAHRDPSVANP